MIKACNNAAWGIHLEYLGTLAPNYSYSKIWIHLLLVDVFKNSRGMARKCKLWSDSMHVLWHLFWVYTDCLGKWATVFPEKTDVLPLWIFSFSTAETLKIRSRSLKSNQFFILSQLRILENLVRIQPLVQKILCRQESVREFSVFLLLWPWN